MSFARSATFPKSCGLPGRALKIRSPRFAGPGFPRVAAAGPGCRKRLDGGSSAEQRRDGRTTSRRCDDTHSTTHATGPAHARAVRVRLKFPPLVRVRVVAWRHIGLRIMECGARCRDGHRCRQRSLRGRRRCRRHGRLSPGTPQPMAGYQALVRWQAMRRAMGLKASLGGRPRGRWAWRAKDHREMWLRCLDELIEALSPPVGPKGS